MIDLGSKHPITSIKLAFFSGNPRVYPFTIEVSEDGKTWTQVLDTKNSGTTDQLEEYVLETTRITEGMYALSLTAIM